jgi:hypothetical protein
MKAKLSLSTFWVLRTFAARQAQKSYKSCGGSSARRDLCRGREVTRVPAATAQDLDRSKRKKEIASDCRRDDRRKTIFYKLVRLTVGIGCMIDCRLDTDADIDLFGYATNKITGKGQFI